MSGEVTAGWVVSSHLIEDKPAIFATRNDTNEVVPVTTVFTSDGEEWDVSELTKEDDNPLIDGVCAVAGPDKQGKWYNIALDHGGFKYVN